MLLAGNTSLTPLDGKVIGNDISNGAVSSWGRAGDKGYAASSSLADCACWRQPWQRVKRCKNLRCVTLLSLRPWMPAGADPVQEPTDVKYYPSDEPVRMGLEQFNRGNYGLSQRYFKDAVEKAPKDVTAWIGLAASYDRLRRFDLADQAYAAGDPAGGRNRSDPE